ncbi:hypothetical protein D9M69_680520 [compost metagenome]
MAVDERAVHAGQELLRLHDARQQVVPGLLFVGKARGRDARDARRAQLRGVARALDLAGQREHVGRQPRIDQRRRVDALRLRVRKALIEQMSELAESAGENRHGQVVHREGHGEVILELKSAGL